MTNPTAEIERPLEPLWRGMCVFRVLALICAGVVVVIDLPDYAVPAGAVAMFLVIVGWTAVSGLAYLRGPVNERRRRWTAVLDVVVTVAVMGTTILIQTERQLANDAAVTGSVWTSGAVLACALAFGIPGGFGAAVCVSLTLLLVQDYWWQELYDIQLLLLAGLTVGFAATVLRRSSARVRAAVAAEAAARERERLARAVHDGVLQVLGLVRRRGSEIGGPAGELGVLAGEQEVVLRTLLTTGTAPVNGNGHRDLAAALRMLGSPRVTVSAPAHEVELSAHVVDELVAVVGAALANVAVHVGADAPAWVLLEELGDAIEISVRDEGPGIPDGRLAAAEAEGRIGVARSMRGRVLELGGTITCDTGPDRGTEWIIRLALGDGA